MRGRDGRGRRRGLGLWWAAGKARDALADGITDRVDEVMSSAFDGARDVVSHGWDMVTRWL